MSKFTVLFIDYYHLMKKMSSDKVLLSKLERLHDNNVRSLLELDLVLASGDVGEVLKFVQFHCNSEDPWKDENRAKANHIDPAAAAAKLKELRLMIERTTIAVLIATMGRHNLSGGEHQVFRKNIRAIWDAESFGANTYRMRVHSSHLGLSPDFAHGKLQGNSVLAGMVALTHEHADNWHSYVFNVCLIKIADSAAEKAPGAAGRLLLITQNNRLLRPRG
jgi:hypothetical protein